VDTGILGAGDAEVVLNDATREVRMGTLLYYESFAQTPYRQLVTLPSATLAGIWGPTYQGWTLYSGSTGTAVNHESDLVTTQAAGTSIRYRKSLSGMTPPYIESTSIVMEARFAVDYQVTDGTGLTGIGFSADVGPLANVGVRLLAWPSPEVQLVTTTGVVVQSYPFNWDDGEFHTYRVVVSSGAVSLFLDDTFYAPAENLVNFPGGGGGWLCTFGATAVTATAATTVRWRSVGFAAMPSAVPDLHRTLGIFKGTSLTNLDHWAVPRTDGLTVPNSDASAVIEEMDWRNDSEIRLLRDPRWGVTLYRPDMPPPPTHLVPPDFATEIADPGEGWVNVEYGQLPYVPQKFGFVTFGAPDKRAFTQQHWNWVRSRLFKPFTDNYIAPQHMVLNWANTVSSGDRNLQNEPETVIVQSLDSRRVSLKPTHLYASSVYKLVEGTTIYTQEMYTLDPASQTITLGQDSLGNDLTFSGDHVPVTVMFIPGSPVTTTYLLNRPLLDSAILLNEGTPPYPKNQTADPSFAAGTAPTGPGNDKTWQAAVGTTGVLDLALSTLTDTSVDMSKVLTGYELRVLSGSGVGTYTITSDGGAGHSFTIVPAPPADDTDVTWEVWGGFDLAAAPSTSTAGNLATFVDDPESQYASMQFFEVDNDGWKGLIATPYDGEPWEMAFSGLMVWQPIPVPLPITKATDQCGGLPGKILFASGGSYLGPVVDGSGTIINTTPLGGTLGPGTAVLYPSGRPSTQWVVYQTNWDGGSSVWDAGATAWEYMEELAIPVQYVTFQTYWDAGGSAWDGGATLWDWDTRLPTPIQPPMVQTEWHLEFQGVLVGRLEVPLEETLTNTNLSRTTFDLRDLMAVPIEFWQVST
jgi:hypothetical protein